MEYMRALLLGALLLVAFMLWSAWQNDYPQPVTQTQPTSAATQAVPAITTATMPGAGVQQPAAVPATQTVPAATTTHQFVHVKTDVLNVTIDTLGGNIVQTSLPTYPQQVAAPNPQPFELLTNDPNKLYVAQSGLIGNQGPDTEQGQVTYTTNKTSYTLTPGSDVLTVTLHWQNPQGLKVDKIFTFHRNDYQILVDYQIVNNSKTTWSGQFYTQLQRKKLPAPNRGLFNINPYVGGAISTPDKPYQKISFDKMQEQNLNTLVQGGWIAMLEHYFLSAWIPPSQQLFTFYSQAGANEIYTLGALSPTLTVQPGQKLTTGAKLYTGPEILDRLKAVAPHLNLTVDYGILWFISIAIFWLLKHVYDIVGNWGWAIVIVTILIKLAFYHLSAKSYRSMAAMRDLQPRLQLLRERYADDRQKMTQATMELYRSEKINPLGGCLPIIVQIPVFIALYWVLIESVELRQAPFIFWIHDLSVKDPYYILPVIMGLTMFLQQKLNPPPPDPTQAKVMQFLPLFFVFLFLNFPSGLVLYWIVNNTVSILQQWYIMKRFSKSKSKKKK